MRRVLALAFLLGCGNGAANPTPEAALDTVRTRAEVDAHDGQRVHLEGVVVRPDMALGPGNTWKATGLKLDDGTTLWVDYKPAPPPEWAAHEGQRVTLDALVWRAAPPDRKSAPTGPHLSEWTPPQPAP